VHMRRSDCTASLTCVCVCTYGFDLPFTTKIVCSNVNGNCLLYIYIYISYLWLGGSSKHGDIWHCLAQLCGSNTLRKYKLFYLKITFENKIHRNCVQFCLQWTMLAFWQGIIVFCPQIYVSLIPSSIPNP
jgi:hypothetical protein